MTSNVPRWPGDSTTPFCLHLAADLQELGWRVDILAPHAPGAAPDETLDGVVVERFRYAWPETAETVCYGGGALINLRKRRSDFLKLPGLVAAEAASALRRLRTGSYDLLHTHWTLPQGFVGALASATTGTPHVLTCHGEEFFAMQSRAFDPFKRFTLHRADVVTANSSVTEAAALQAAPRIRDIRRIPMGVTTDMTADPDVVDTIRRRFRRDGGPLLFFVGRNVEEKGIEDLVRAVALLVPRLPDVSAIVAGEGQDRASFEKLAAELGVADRVSFIGWAPREDLPSYYAAADVFVAPSRRGPDGWVEGQGITPIESMVMRTPVVATSLGGYGDSMLHERTGLVVDERSPDQIAAAVQRIVSEPGLVATLREEGHRLATTRFSRPAVAAAFSEVFEQALSRRYQPSGGLFHHMPKS